jgi:hypothetical protein
LRLSYKFRFQLLFRNCRDVTLPFVGDSEGDGDGVGTANPSPSCLSHKTAASNDGCSLGGRNLRLY